jgi:hypothetical protein
MHSVNGHSGGGGADLFFLRGNAIHSFLTNEVQIDIHKPVTAEIPHFKGYHQKPGIHRKSIIVRILPSPRGMWACEKADFQKDSHNSLA